MTEKSYFWTTGGAGDGASTYTRTDLSVICKILIACNGIEGIGTEYLNACVGSVPGVNTVRIGTGVAVVDGKPYLTDTTVDVTIPSAVGAGNTRIDRIVLRANWTAQTVRITRIAGVDAAAPTAPAITESSGTTYDTKTYQALVTTGGTVTLTDERTMAMVASDSIENDAVTDAILRNSAGLSVIGRSANSTGDPADIAAASDGQVLRRSGTTLGFGTVATAGIADDAVTAAKIAAGAVGNSELAADAVTTDKIATGAVGTADLADNAVTGVKMRDSAALSVIGNATNATGDPTDIAAGSDGYVLRRSGTTLGFGQVATAGIADNAITSAKIAAGAVGNSDLAADAVTTDKIAAGAVGTTDVADNAISNAKIRDSVGNSVIGRRADTTGDPEDIWASADGQVLVRVASQVGFGYVITESLVDNAVTDPKLRNSAGLSVIGRSANSTGDPADIAAASDGQVLRRSGTTLGFGTVATAGIADEAVTDAKLRDSAATSVIGRSAGSTGTPDDIQAYVDGVVLHRTSGLLAFGQVATADVADNAISNAKIRDSVGNSVIGRRADTTGDPEDIWASADGQVLVRVASQVGFGYVITESLVNDAVDDTKVGNRVPAFTRRKGGSATVWSDPGSTVYTPTTVRMQAGALELTILNGTSSITGSVTFPVAFSNIPLALVSVVTFGVSGKYNVVVADVSATTLYFYLFETTGGVVSGDKTLTINWQATGPE